MDITPRNKSKIIIPLSLHTTKSQREIAKICYVDHTTVSRIRKRHSQGSVSPKRKGNCGRKRKTTKHSVYFMLRQGKIDPRKTSDALQKELELVGVNIRSSTVRRRLLERGRERDEKSAANPPNKY